MITVDLTDVFQYIENKVYETLESVPYDKATGVSPNLVTKYAFVYNSLGILDDDYLENELHNLFKDAHHLLDLVSMVDDIRNIVEQFFDGVLGRRWSDMDRFYDLDVTNNLIVICTEIEYKQKGLTSWPAIMVRPSAYRGYRSGMWELI